MHSKPINEHLLSKSNLVNYFSEEKKYIINDLSINTKWREIDYIENEKINYISNDTSLWDLYFKCFSVIVFEKN